MVVRIWKQQKKKREKLAPPTKGHKELIQLTFHWKNMDGLWDLGQQLHETEHTTVQLGLEADRNLGWLQYKAVSLLKDTRCLQISSALTNYIKWYAKTGSRLPQNA